MAETPSDDGTVQRTQRQITREVEMLLAAVEAATADLAVARSPHVRRLLDAAWRARTALRAA